MTCDYLKPVVKHLTKYLCRDQKDGVVKKGNYRKLKLQFLLFLNKSRDRLDKNSHRYGRNNPTLIFENLKPVEKSKNHFNILWTSLKIVYFFEIRRVWLIWIKFRQRGQTGKAKSKNHSNYSIVMRFISNFDISFYSWVIQKSKRKGL